MRYFFPTLAAAALVGCGSNNVTTTDGGRDAHAPSEAGDAHARDAAHDAGQQRHDAEAHDAAPADARGDSGDAGIPCYANTDCKEGSCSYTKTVCEAGTCGGVAACPGTCVAFAGENEPCLFPGPPACTPDSGFTCSPFTHTCMSAASMTLPVADAGGKCGLGVASCIPGDYCFAPTFPDNGQCMPVVPDGGACDINIAGACAGSLACVGYTGGTCHALSGDGGACLTQPAGTSGGNSGCSTGLFCADGGCVPLPTAGPCLGGQCNPDASFCSDAGSCAPWVANGAACASAAECSSGYCSSTTNTCVTALPVGAECTDGPYDCSGGICPDGTPSCVSGICDTTGHCAASYCAKPKQ